MKKNQSLFVSLPVFPLDPFGILLICSVLLGIQVLAVLRKSIALLDPSESLEVERVAAMLLEWRPSFVPLLAGEEGVPSSVSAFLCAAR